MTLSAFPVALVRAQDYHLVACSVAWLTPDEAEAKKHLLLFKAATPVAEVPARADGRQAYRLCKTLLPAAQVGPVLTELTQERMALGTGAVRVRDTGRTTALTYWGYPLAVRDWSTGELSAHPALSHSFVVPGHLEQARRDIVLTMLAHSLAAMHDVPVQALLLPFAGVNEHGPCSHLATVRQGARLFMQALPRLAPSRFIKGEAASATRALRDHLLDPAVARLARLASRASLVLAEYEQVRVHQALYVRVREQTPRLLPLAHLYVSSLPEALRRAREPGAKEAVLQGFNEARARLLSQPLTSKQTWKYLLKVPRSAMKAHMQPDMQLWGVFSSRTAPDRGGARNPGEALELALTKTLALQKLERVGVPVQRLSSRATRAALSSLWAGRTLEAIGRVPPERMQQLTGLLLEQLNLVKGQPAEAAREVAQGARNMLDWLFAEGFAQRHPNQHDTWARLLQRSRQWHQRERAAVQAPSRAARWKLAVVQCEKKFAGHTAPDGLGWDGLLEPFEWKGLSARPLRTAQALWDEHLQMHHCVDTYLPACWSGSSRLFSLSDPAHPKCRSTLELVRGESGAWMVRQHEGPSGHQPAKALEPLAAELLNRANRPAAHTGSLQA